MAETSEQERLSVLRGYGVLDTAPEAAFDEIADAIARFCGAPMAAVSLVDEHRQWFKAEVGLGVRETPRDVSFCAHAMLGEALYIVPDARKDVLFAGNALVTGDPNIRFYAGAPIRSPEGVALGALCVIDTVPRPQGLTDDQATLLKLLAKQVEAQLRLRRLVEIQTLDARHQADLVAEAVVREERLVAALGSAAVGWWDWDTANERVVANESLARDFGLPQDAAGAGMPVSAFFNHVHPNDRGWLAEAVREAVATGASFREDFRIVDADGDERWVSARGRCLRDADGRPWRFPGVAIDITDRKRTEQSLREADVGRELAMQAAQLGRFDHAPYRGRRYLDARALEIYGLTAEEGTNLDSVLAQVHPEDRPSLRAGLDAAVDPNRTGPFRHSFRLIRPRTGEERWINAVGQTLFRDGQCIRFMGVLEDVTEARRSEEHRRLLAHELNHRMKNTLAIVLSLVNNSLRDDADPATARGDINGRIQALSRANDLLTAKSWSAALTAEIVEGLVQSLSLPADRLELSGPPVALGPRPAMQLALALHELATNAVKYGAFANDTGKIALTWAIEEIGGVPTFAFDWKERGGPPFEAPTRQGFGSRLTQRATALAFGGQVSADYRPNGLHWRLTAPYEGLAEAGRSEEQI